MEYIRHVPFSDNFSEMDMSSSSLSSKFSVTVSTMLVIPPPASSSLNSALVSGGVTFTFSAVFSFGSSLRESFDLIDPLTERGDPMCFFSDPVGLGVCTIWDDPDSDRFILLCLGAGTGVVGFSDEAGLLFGLSIMGVRRCIEGDAEVRRGVDGDPVTRRPVKGDPAVRRGVQGDPDSDPLSLIPSWAFASAVSLRAFSTSAASIQVTYIIML